ncbi:MAG: hypothetical protein JSR39_07770 [Verrucomicrobia bacterium]|nr:hypothetical protein [Verrucomicrobiota bacterium]
MATKVQFTSVIAGQFPIEQVTSSAPPSDANLLPMLETLNVDDLKKKTCQYLSIENLNCSGISTSTALQWQSRIAAGTLSIEGQLFPFSDQLDCTLEQLSAALGTKRSLELRFITPSESALNAILELIAANRLEHLELRGFLISDDYVEKLSTAISSSRALRSLVMHNLRLNTDHFIRLSGAIKESPAMENITIKSDWIKEKAVAPLKEMIESCKSLKTICLTLDKFEKIPALASLKENLRKGQTLDLSENWGY